MNTPRSASFNFATLRSVGVRALHILIVLTMILPNLAGTVGTAAAADVSGSDPKGFGKPFGSAAAATLKQKLIPKLSAGFTRPESAAEEQSVLAPDAEDLEAALQSAPGAPRV